MNFILGIGLVLVAAAIFCVYLLGLLFVVFFVRWIVATWQYNKNESDVVHSAEGLPWQANNTSETMSRPGFFRKNDKRLAILMAVFTFSMTGFTYINQRIDWMGDDNAYFKAKEYWVAGQVVLGFRTVLDIFFQPDSYVAEPFIYLQKMIFNQGVQYLPENDGEIGVWKNNWFVYPIAKTMGSPRGTGSWKYSPRMIALLETAWSAIEQQASFPFADRQMETQHYYRNFPGQAFYYNYRKGHYAGEKTGSAVFYTRDEKLITRSKQLVKWLIELEKKWITSPETQAFLKKHPKVQAIRQIVCIMESKDVIRNEIMTNQFTCENESVHQYLEFREAFAGNGKDRPPYKRMADYDQAKHLYNVAINIESNRFMRYILEKYCSLKAAGNEDMSPHEGWGIPTEEMYKKSMNALFKDELIKLKEWNNDQHD